VQDDFRKEVAEDIQEQIGIGGPTPFDPSNGKMGDG